MSERQRSSRAGRGGSAAAFGPPLAQGIGSFSIVLGAVFVMVLAGLLVADRALDRAIAQQVRSDAESVSVLLDDAVKDHAGALVDFRGLFAQPTPATRSAEGRSLLPGVVADWLRADRVWVVDSTGALVLDSTLASTTPPVAVDPRRDSTVRAAMERAYDSGALQVAIVPGIVRPGPERELVLAQPLVTDGRVRGVAGALLPASELLGSVERQHPPVRVSLVVRAGRDTLLVEGRPRAAGSVETATWPVQVAGATPWTVEVQHEVSGRRIRRGLWVVSLIAMIFLAAGLLRERRQAIRISDRSSELERLSSELLRANRMKSEFLANVSHELRTPLNAIVGFVELLRDGVYGDLSPRQVQPVERIAASASHLRHLVDQVLDIAKMAAGRLEVHPETIVLRPFVLNVASELESLISERGLSLSIAVGASLPRVRTDPQHLRQILVNLIGNDVKYTPQSGSIAVRARLVGAPGVAGAPASPEEAALRARAPRSDRPWIALQVIDTGIGIAPGDQERIFDEFEQVNAGPRGDSMNRGTGLGLPISRRLARLLDGEITVESTVGKGSIFTVWLPVSPGEGA